MVVTLDKISNVQQVQSIEKIAPSPDRKGLSNTPNSIQFGKLQNKASGWDCVKAFFSAIWNFITCGCFKKEASSSTATEQETLSNKALQYGTSIINSHLDIGAKNITHPEPVAAVLIFNKGTLVADRIDFLDKDFKTTALGALKQAVQDKGFKADSEILIQTIVFEKRGDDSFDVHSWMNSQEYSKEKVAFQRERSSKLAKGSSVASIESFLRESCNNSKDVRSRIFIGSVLSILKECTIESVKN